MLDFFDFFSKNPFLIFSIFVLFIVSLGVVCANDDVDSVVLSSSELEDGDVCDSFIYENDGINSSFSNLSDEDSIVGEDSVDDVDFNHNSLLNDSNELVPVSRDVSLSSDLFPAVSTDEKIIYLEDINSSNSDRYFSFVNYLIGDCGFEFSNSSNVGDGYLLFATRDYNATFYDGVNFTILPNDYYFISTNDRQGWFIDNMYYDDVIYCHDDNYYLDEEYLGWLVENNNINLTMIPSGDISDIDFTSINTKKNAPVNIVLPSRYDLRDYGFVSSVKDQGNWGNCWAFAAVSALESYLLKNENQLYNISTDWDFSENNLKNVMSSRGRNGTLNEVNKGGNFYMALAYLLRWSGPVNESDDPYGSDYNNFSEDLNVLKHVQGIKFIHPRSNPFDNEEIKMAVYQYGAVDVDIYWNRSYEGLGSTTYFYDSNITDNNWHAITIVGWDDDYPATNFKSYYDGMGNGAFIIKNSWGTNINNESGYFYVSYYDRTIANRSIIGFGGFVFTDVENVNNYGYNYNYDSVGIMSWGSNGNTKTKFANQWVANKNEVLKAFGLYVKGPSYCNVSVSVNDINVGSSMIVSLNYAGFHTINFTEPINVSEGDTFRVEVVLQNNGFYDTHILPVEFVLNGYSSPDIIANQSFIWSNNQWQILNISNDSNANICLHVFTECGSGFVETHVLACDLVTDFNCSDLNATLVDVNGTPLVGKKVFFKGFINSVEKTYNRTTDSNGRFSLPIHLVPGSYKFLISFLGDDVYHQSSRQVSVVVNKMKTSITATNSWCYYGEYLNVTLKDNNGKAIAGKKIIFNLLNKTYNKTTDDDGRASLSINLYNNTYKVVINFTGGSCYYKSSITINFKVYKAPAKITVSSYDTTYNSGKYFTVKVQNNKTNNIIKNTKICLKVYTGSTYKEYNITTNSDGIAKINLSKLSIGNHSVQISSKNTNVVFATIKKTIKISKASTIVTAPNITSKYKTSQTFKITIKHKTSDKIISGLKILLKVYTGSSYNSYNLTTNISGVASFNVKSLSIGTHKVVISSRDSNYYVTANSTIKITNT